MQINTLKSLSRICGDLRIGAAAIPDSDAPINNLKTLERELIALSKDEGSSRITATIPIICAVLFAIYICLVTVAVYEVKLRPTTVVVWIPVLRIIQSLIGICIMSYPTAQSIDHWWCSRARDLEALEVERQFDEELALMRRVSSKLFMNEVGIKRIQMQVKIISFRANRLPNWITASSTLLAIPLSVLLSLWLQEPVKIESLLDYRQPNSFVVFGVVTFFATLLLASLSRTDKLARDQELHVRMAYILKLARGVQG